MTVSFFVLALSAVSNLPLGAVILPRDIRSRTNVEEFVPQRNRMAIFVQERNLGWQGIFNAHVKTLSTRR